MRLVFLGPPGAGKGTQAKVLSGDFNVAHISTGDLLREAVKNNSAIGRQAKAFMEKGELVPDELVIRMVVQRLGEPDTEPGFILDGFPRTRPQAVSLDDELKKAGLGIDLVLYFRTSEETVIKRLSGRRVCRSCGANYHLATMRPKKDGVCDVCGGELYQRQDDTEETVKNRLVVYQLKTQALIEYYASRGILETVSGDLSVDQLRSELTAVFNSRGLLR